MDSCFMVGGGTCHVHLRLAHVLSVMDDSVEKARQHQAHRRLGVNARPSVVVAVEAFDLTANPGQIEHSADPLEYVVVRDEVLDAARYEKRWL